MINKIPNVQILQLINMFKIYNIRPTYYNTLYIQAQNILYNNKLPCNHRNVVKLLNKIKKDYLW